MYSEQLLVEQPMTGQFREEVLDVNVVHVLYSRGHLFDDTNQEEALEKLATITRKTTQQIEKRLLSGRRKKVKSSHSLEKLLKLKRRLTDIGLDVYIELGVGEE